jgi:ABC-type glycerol-3-phosphate transport system permease component
VTGSGQASRPGAPRPAGAPGPGPGISSARARRVKLTVSRVDPWSAMKMSFLISVALGIAFVVMVAVLWMILSGMGVFSEINRLVGTIFSDQSNPFDIMDFLGFGRVLSLSIVIGVIDVILMTALSTLGAFLYNICSALVGGLQLTLTDD